MPEGIPSKRILKRIPEKQKMCGHSSRVAQGGTIAVLSPPPGRSATMEKTLFEGELYFQKGKKTSARFLSKSNCGVAALTGCVVVIQFVFEPQVQKNNINPEK